jgi:pectin methylesterase-like acyl-CoA thioesterase
MSRWLPGAAAVLAAGLVALAGAGQASAATLTVCPSGCTFSTIQAAIDAAGSGDKIKIAAGSYSENLITGGKDLSLAGAGARKTTIAGAGSGTVVTIGSGSVEIRGVTITGGNAAQLGGGILNTSGTLTLKKSKVTGNTAANDGGINTVRTATLNNCTVQCNSPDDIVGPFTESNSKIGPPAPC